MSTKTEVTNNISTKIDTGGDSTALEVREVLATDTNSIVENLYPTTTSITDITNTATISFGSEVSSVDLKVVKQGNEVKINGFIRYSSASGALLTITDANFNPDGIFYGNGYIFNNPNAPETPVKIFVTGTNMSCLTTVLALETISINITYNTAD